MKQILSILLFIVTISTYSQNSDCGVEDIVGLEKYVKLIYMKNPFDGVKIIPYNSCDYIIGSGITSNGGNKNQSIKDRISSVKARRNVVTFLNGSTVSSETIITTGQKISDDRVSYFENYIDEIKENSSGFVNGMQTLTTFTASNGQDYVHILFKKL